jgi:hypothetical protein
VFFLPRKWLRSDLDTFRLRRIYPNISAISEKKDVSLEIVFGLEQFSLFAYACAKSV